MLSKKHQGMYEELKEAKQMLKVPRMHFKQVEAADFDSLTLNFSEFQEKLASMEKVAPGHRARMRIDQILKKDQPLREDKLKLLREVAALKLDQVQKAKFNLTVRLDSNDARKVLKPMTPAKDYATDRPLLS